MTDVGFTSGFQRNDGPLWARRVASVPESQNKRACVEKVSNPQNMYGEPTAYQTIRLSLNFRSADSKPADSQTINHIPHQQC